MRSHRTAWPAWLLGGLLLLSIVLLAANLWRLSRPLRPDPRLVNLAVRATLYALPSPTPIRIEVTRVVEIVVTAQPTPTAIPTYTPTAQPTATAEATATPEANSPAALASSSPDEPAPVEAAPVEAAQPVDAQADALLAAGAQAQRVAPEPIPAPDAADSPPSLPALDSAACPTASDRRYVTIPTDGGGLDHPDGEHADLNLALRGYSPVAVPLSLFNKDGPVDGDPPQLAGIFPDGRGPAFTAAGRVNDWDWGCGAHGCRGGPLTAVDATFVILAAGPGEPITVPRRGQQIYGGGYKALVLYAEPTRITLGFTRRDSVADGYVVHLEAVCVDPNLVAGYQSSNAAGRAFLPALREGEVLGTAGPAGVGVAVRDRGVFFDPRSRLDWWQGF